MSDIADPVLGLIDGLAALRTAQPAPDAAGHRMRVAVAVAEVATAMRRVPDRAAELAGLLLAWLRSGSADDMTRLLVPLGEIHAEGRT